MSESIFCKLYKLTEILIKTLILDVCEGTVVEA